MVRPSAPALPIVVSPFRFVASETANEPLTVVAKPVLPIETAVAAVVPRLRAAAESSVRSPEEVDQVEAAPAVKVSAPPEVNCDAPKGVKLTEPAPSTLKFPEASV